MANVLSLAGRRYNKMRLAGALSWAHCLWRIIPLPPRCGVRLSIVMTVLVTGATGFLGRRVVQGLLDSGQEVRVMVRRPGSESVFATPPTDVCYGNITDRQCAYGSLSGNRRRGAPGGGHPRQPQAV